jgi:hypothetical protein
MSPKSRPSIEEPLESLSPTDRAMQLDDAKRKKKEQQEEEKRKKVRHHHLVDLEHSLADDPLV